MRLDAFLFGESQSRMLVSVARGNAAKVREQAEAADVPLSTLGEVGGSRLVIGDAVDVAVADLRARWERGLESRLGL